MLQTGLELIEPSPESNTFCGDPREKPGTYCTNQNGVGIDIFITIPLKYLGMHTIGYECGADGEDIDRSTLNGRVSDTDLYVGFMAGGPVYECEAPQDTYTNWTVDSGHTGTADTTDSSASFGFGGGARADVMKSYSNAGYDYEDTVQMTLTRMRITID